MSVCVYVCMPAHIASRAFMNEFCMWHVCMYPCMYVSLYFLVCMCTLSCCCIHVYILLVYVCTLFCSCIYVYMLLHGAGGERIGAADVTCWRDSDVYVMSARDTDVMKMCV